MLHRRPVDTEASQTPMNPSARTRRRGAREAGADDEAARQQMTSAVPVDPLAFPDLATRRSVDGGVAAARWQALLDEGGPILADGAMGTMLFSAGLQFGDPPEVWNLTHPDVVRQIVDQGETIESLSGKTRQISILFSDIRGFTTLSETRPPQEIVALLNRYFSRQVGVVFRHGGTLDKFIGDCIMAFWGAPLEDPRHAEHAVAAALEMEQVLLAFQKELGEAGRDFDVGIGIHTGPAVVGFIGAEQKLDYTAIGDSVNLASRIEGLTKDARSRILVSRETMAACDNAFAFSSRGSYKVKGRTQEVELFEPKVESA